VRQIKSRISPGERRRLPVRLAEVAAALPDGLVADIANLYWEFSELRPEIVHAWLDWSNVRAGLAAALAGVPKVLVSGRNLNPSHFALYASYMDPAYRALAKCPNVVILNNSNAGAHDYADWIGIARDRIRVIRNGIDFGTRGRLSPAETAGLRRSHGIPEQAFVVGGVFRFAEEKRPLLWIDAAKLIADRIPGVDFVLFGTGYMRDEMEACIRAYGLVDRFSLPGVTDDVLSVMSMMDVFMLTSSGEGIPNVVLEAQWVGTPVVATNAGGTAEAVDPDVTGWILDDVSAQALAHRVHVLFTDRDLQQSVRKRGPALVRARFGVKRMIDETWTAYGYATDGA
jgi:glycosyltransferase involved in cell wall biosynthesis